MSNRMQFSDSDTFDRIEGIFVIPFLRFLLVESIFAVKKVIVRICACWLVKKEIARKKWEKSLQKIIYDYNLFLSAL